MKILKFRNKNDLLEYFWAGIWKYPQRPQICLIAKFRAKIKILKLETKNARLGYFQAGIENDIAILEISAFRVCVNAKIPPRVKMPKLVTKNTLFGHLWTGIWKSYCDMWNQHPRIFLIAKFHTKMNILKSRTKYATGLEPTTT